MPRLVAISVLGLALAGCYVSHDGAARPGDGDPGRVDAGFPRPVDASLPPLDGDVPPPFDSSFPPPVDGDVPPPPVDGDVPPPPPVDGDVPPPPFDGAPPPPVDSGPAPVDAGPPRPALRMSASTFLEVGDQPAFDLEDASTFEVWLRSRETGTAQFCAKGDGTARHMLVGLRDGALVAGWQVAGREHFVTGPTFPVDTWTHVALVIVPQPVAPVTRWRAILYVNGAEVGRRSGLPELTDTFNDQPFRCGRADVDVDEIRLWRVRRSGPVIAANHDRRVSGSIPGMLSYWRLDESGQIALDYTAMGRVGVLGRLTTADPADPTWIDDGPF